MNAIGKIHPLPLPMSPLERERRDDAAVSLQHAVETIVNNPVQRWTDEQVLVIGLATQALKGWLMNRKDNR